MKIVNEHIEQFLKPKSKEELKDAFKNISYDNYTYLVDEEIDVLIYGAHENYVLSNYTEIASDCFKNKIPPIIAAKKILEDYWKNKLNPELFKKITNKAIMELQFNDNDSNIVLYKFKGEKIPKQADIYYDEYNGEYNDRQCFDDENDFKWHLDTFKPIYKKRKINESVKNTFKPKSTKDIVSQLSLLPKRKLKDLLFRVSTSLNYETCMIKYLIDTGVDVNCRDEGLNTPLAYAVFYGNVAAVKMLLSLGAIVYNNNQEYKFSILSYISEKDKSDITKLLNKAVNKK